VVVDGVSDVMHFDVASMKEPPHYLGGEFATDYIRGLVAAGERMLVLLDIDRLIGTQLSELSGSAADANAEEA